MPILTVVAGPNGAGKSTLIRNLSIEGIGNPLDTDAIAKAVNPHHPKLAAVTARREVLVRTGSYIQAQQSFVLETTLSGNAAVSSMRTAIAAGFSVNLICVYLDAAAFSMKRVRACRAGRPFCAG